jgi:hypothetical protein
LDVATLRRVVGWEADAILLGRGHDYYLLPTTATAPSTCPYGEQPLDAYAGSAGWLILLRFRWWSRRGSDP